MRTQGFAALVEGHLAQVQDTANLEEAGQALQQGGFQGDDVHGFIDRVCAWGGHWGPQIAHRVLQENHLDVIGQRFRDAVDVLLQDAPDVGRALEVMTEINGFGVSFGSKHLRFLKPGLCPVLDDKISRRFWHPLTRDGYRCLSHDCLKIASKLQECGIQNPLNRPNGRWFAADVEMALFAFAQDWRNEP